MAASRSLPSSTLLVPTPIFVAPPVPRITRASYGIKTAAAPVTGDGAASMMF